MRQSAKAATGRPVRRRYRFVGAATTLAVLSLAIPTSAAAQGLSCIVPFSPTPASPVSDILDHDGFAALADAGLLVATQTGLYLIRSESGTAAAEPFAHPITGPVSGLVRFPDGTTLVGTQNGLFSVRSADGVASIVPVATATGPVSNTIRTKL